MTQCLPSTHRKILGHLWRIGDVEDDDGEVEGVGESQGTGDVPKSLGTKEVCPIRVVHQRPEIGKEMDTHSSA